MNMDYMKFHHWGIKLSPNQGVMADSVHKNKPKEMEVTYRKYKQIDKTMFKEDLQRTLKVGHTTLDL